MNEQMNAPMLPEPSGVSAWLSSWREAITRPSEQTFVRMAQSPQAKSSTAFIWIFLASLVSSFLASLVQGAVLRQLPQSAEFGFDQFGAGNALVGAICGAPIAAILALVVFAIFVGVVQLIARMFGGRGTYDQLAYTIGAIVAPYYLFSGLMSLLAAIPVPFVGLCFGSLGLLALLYVIVLEMMAVKGVNQFGWGEAAASVLLPFVGLACCIAAVIAGLVSVLVPVIRETYDQLPPLLTPNP